MTEVFEGVLLTVPATPVGVQAVWYLTQLHEKGASITLEDYARLAPELARGAGEPESVEAARAQWRANSAGVGDLRDLEILSRTETEIEIVVIAEDRRWALTMSVEPSPPHRITKLGWNRAYDFEISVREAAMEDALVLADLESRCPIELGGAKTWFDRAGHYFDGLRLAENFTVGLVSVDGLPAAVSCGARHVARIGGELKSLLAVSHLRVLPEHQRKGLWAASNTVFDKYFPEVDSTQAYVAVDNAAMQHGFRQQRNRWPSAVLRARLHCDRHAGGPAGQSARPDDLPEVVEILNAFNAESEMFNPYTVSSLSARLQRAPDLYSLEHLWISNGAVVGVWPAGRALRVVSETDGEQIASEPGLVLDYGFAPGCEASFEALLGAWCGWLQQRGMNRLSIFTSPNAGAAPLITALADDIEAFNMWTPNVAVPEGADRKSLYVDPVYA